VRLLVTRPVPDGERSAAMLRARGHEVVVAPVLRMEIVAAAFGQGPFAALVITSGNAMRALASHPRRDELARLPVFAVGARSAEAAREAGFSDVVSADGDVSDLVGLLVARFAGLGVPLLYLAGEDRAGDLAGALAAHGVSVETAVVYRAVPVEAFPTQLRAALAAAPIDGVLHYSRRSAAAFLAGAAAAGLLQPALSAEHFCLSAAVAIPLTQAGARSVRIASAPDEASLVALLSPL
jgi:uroporphyrinogen-III synthase